MKLSEELSNDRIAEAQSWECSKRKKTMVSLTRAALPCWNPRPHNSLAVTTADAVDKLLEETSIYQDKVLAARRAAEEAEAAAAAAAAEGPSLFPANRTVFFGDSDFLRRAQRRHSRQGISYLRRTKPSERLSC